MTTLRTLIAALLVAFVSGAAFVPAPRTSRVSTAASFGFLKELGLEKPSWLPDFGGKKEDDTPAEAVAAQEEGDSSEGAPAEEAPADESAP